MQTVFVGVDGRRTYHTRYPYLPDPIPPYLPRTGDRGDADCESASPHVGSVGCTTHRIRRIRIRIQTS